MKKLLRIDASLRSEGSHSRALADYFEAAWRKKYPTGKVIYRDLTKVQIPHLQNETVQAFYLDKANYTEKDEEAIALSDALIRELKFVDQVLVSSPLYNLNIPSPLKSYLDHIIRSGQTFELGSDGSYKGLLLNEASYIITAKGETYKGTPMEALDFQEPYLKAIFGFIGLELKGVFALEATAHPEILEQNRRLQQQNIMNTLNNI